MTKTRQRERARRGKAEAGKQFDPTPNGLFHGGRAGLAVGSYLTPPRERGERRIERQLEEAGLDEVSHHPDWVFFCDDPLLALSFAHRHLSVALYEVEPDGDVEEDEDGGVGSYKCKRAKIVRLVTVPHSIIQKLRARLIARGRHDAGADFEWLLCQREMAS
jgi:hypothetical protein